MPELPEVQTTVDGLNKHLVGKKIVGIWSSYDSLYFKGKENIKDRAYFTRFKKAVLPSSVRKAERVGKNILVHLSNGVAILIHMKMTGHLLYGEYKKQKSEWVPIEDGPLLDPFNKHIRLVFELANGKHLAFSDMRKFGKVLFIKQEDLGNHPDISAIAPDPFELSKKEFVKRLRKKKSGRIKNVLMDQAIISGIGNIYSDEVLFAVGVHPETNIQVISDRQLGEMLVESKKILKRGIDFGGDSTSDYRDIEGKRGTFQNKHKVYRKTGSPCSKRGCAGTIERKVVGGRSAHFCDKHQKLPRPQKRFGQVKTKAKK